MPFSRTPFIFVAIFAIAAAPRQAAAQFTNGQSAFRVIGQTNFTANSSGVSTTTLNLPVAVAIDAARGKMYVSDYNNNRVVRYAYPVVTNGPAAEVAFGQPTLTSSAPNNGGVGAASLNLPFSMCLDTSGTLYVADYGNNRVLAYTDAHLVSANGPSAVRVLGQPNLTGSSFGNSSTTMRNPISVAWESPDRLWVAELTNDRVLRFENVSQKPNGAAADGVLGQPGFMSSGSGTTAARIFGPYAVAVSGGTLFVADTGNQRVLGFANAAAKANGASANGVLGQANFTSNATAVSATGLDMPAGLCVDLSGRLYISDNGSSRVVYHSAVAGKTNGAAADGVLGQSNFTGFGSSTTASTLNFPYGVDVDSTNNVLAIVDTFSNRVVLQQASSPLPAAVSGVSVE